MYAFGWLSRAIFFLQLNLTISNMRYLEFGANLNFSPVPVSIYGNFVKCHPVSNFVTSNYSLSWTKCLASRKHFIGYLELF